MYQFVIQPIDVSSQMFFMLAIDVIKQQEKVCSKMFDKNKFFQSKFFIFFLKNYYVDYFTILKYDLIVLVLRFFMYFLNNLELGIKLVLFIF